MATRKKLNRYEEIMERVQALPAEKQKDYLLEQIALIGPEMMLKDLLTEGVRNPALFNAATALLKYHKIEINPLAAASPTHPVGALAHGLPPADYLSGEEYGVQ